MLSVDLPYRKTDRVVAIYSIKDLEKLSGIKAHTIRMWERRYNILEPQRTKNNVRYYQDDDLKLLLNVALLNKNGFKISRIARMPERELAREVAAISEIAIRDGAQLDALTLSMIEMDEVKFERIMTANIKQIGFERTLIEVIYPFLDKLSLLWLTGSITHVQEKFVSHLIRRKVISAIDAAPLSGEAEAERFFLYLPVGEEQELPLLIMHYLLKIRGKSVLYLGRNVAPADVAEAHRIRPAWGVFTLITETFTREPVQQYVDRLAADLPDARILVSGYQVAVQPIEPAENVVVLPGLEETLRFIDRPRE